MSFTMTGRGTPVDQVDWQFLPYSIALAQTYHWAKGDNTRRDGVVVAARVGDAIGYGEIAPPPHERFDPAQLVGAARRVLDEAHRGHDEFLDALEVSRDNRIRCGLSSAWLAVHGLLEGISLGALLCRGARDQHDEVPVNGLITESSVADAVARAVQLWGDGRRTLKIKCTDSWHEDLDRVAGIRAALPEVALRLDPNESWPRSSLVEIVDRFAAFDIEYMEQPLSAATSMAEFAELRQRLSVPLALDQSIDGPARAREACAQGAADHLVLKPPAVGGPDVVQQIADLAASLGVGCTVTASLESAVGLSVAAQCASALATPMAATGVDTARFFSSNVAAPPTVVDGRVIGLRTPGLTLHEDFVATAAAGPGR